jgi:hypothetical protein
MKKQIFLRGLLGVPLGIAIGYFITIVNSLTIGNGSYSACVPSLVDTFGSEIEAVVFQAVLMGVLGACFGAASLIWEVESWSIAKQTGIYFLVSSLAMFPIAYFTEWMEHSILGFLIYFGIFVAIFIVVWVLQYFIWRKKIDQFNEKIKNR